MIQTSGLGYYFWLSLGLAFSGYKNCPSTKQLKSNKRKFLGELITCSISGKECYFYWNVTVLLHKKKHQSGSSNLTKHLWGNSKEKLVLTREVSGLPLMYLYRHRPCLWSVKMTTYEDRQTSSTPQGHVGEKEKNNGESVTADGPHKKIPTSQPIQKRN